METKRRKIRKIINKLSVNTDIDISDIIDISRVLCDIRQTKVDNTQYVILKSKIVKHSNNLRKLDSESFRTFLFNIRFGFFEYDGGIPEDCINAYVARIYTKSHGVRYYMQNQLIRTIALYIINDVGDFRYYFEKEAIATKSSFGEKFRFKFELFDKTTNLDEYPEFIYYMRKLKLKGIL